MTCRTVKQFADAAAPEELFTGQWQNRPSVLDDYKPYLDDRWSEGCTNAWKLWGDRPARLQGQLPAGSRLPARQAHLTAGGDRQAALTSGRRRLDPPAPDTLTEAEQIQLKAVRTNCPELDALTQHVRSFAAMLTGRQGQRLPDWLDAVRQDDLPSLHTLAVGIDRDRDAVIAGLTLPWNSGAVEGHVNRMKMLKRQMSGRAGFALLRKRVLLSS
ncbi:transposase [Streptomyces sp. NPDC013178]|uniref:transposase n=1 Tax=Streptomyces sp. NPDC013178 TaxID=3155118 RepID=UPI0033E11C48